MWTLMLLDNQGQNIIQYKIVLKLNVCYMASRKHSLVEVDSFLCELA